MARFRNLACFGLAALTAALPMACTAEVPADAGVSAEQELRPLSPHDLGTLTYGVPVTVDLDPKSPVLYAIEGREGEEVEVLVQASVPTRTPTVQLSSVRPKGTVAWVDPKAGPEAKVTARLEWTGRHELVLAERQSRGARFTVTVTAKPPAPWAADEWLPPKPWPATAQVRGTLTSKLRTCNVNRVGAFCRLAPDCVESTRTDATELTVHVDAVGQVTTEAPKVSTCGAAVSAGTAPIVVGTGGFERHFSKDMDWFCMNPDLVLWGSVTLLGNGPMLVEHCDVSYVVQDDTVGGRTVESRDSFTFIPDPSSLHVGYSANVSGHLFSKEEPQCRGVMAEALLDCKVDGALHGKADVRCELEVPYRLASGACSVDRRLSRRISLVGTTNDLFAAGRVVLGDGEVRNNGWKPGVWLELEVLPAQRMRVAELVWQDSDAPRGDVSRTRFTGSSYAVPLTPR